MQLLSSPKLNQQQNTIDHEKIWAGLCYEQGITFNIIMHLKSNHPEVQIKHGHSISKHQITRIQHQTSQNQIKHGKSSKTSLVHKTSISNISCNISSIQANYSSLESVKQGLLKAYHYLSKQGSRKTHLFGENQWNSAYSKV